MKFRKGQSVEWAWGKGHAVGKIAESFTESITRTIKGSKITRHGTQANPAYLILQEKGNEVLKLHSELHKAEHEHGWA